MAQMDRGEQKSPLEMARGAVKQQMLDYLKRAEGAVTPKDWERANQALASIATSITDHDNVGFTNSVKTFTNLAGGPPYNNDSALFQIGDEIPALAQTYWDLKYPAES